jgi:hypothetical protein
MVGYRTPLRANALALGTVCRCAGFDCDGAKDLNVNGRYADTSDD